MQPARFEQADFLLVEINNAKSTSPAVSSGEERGLLFPEQRLVIEPTGNSALMTFNEHMGILSAHASDEIE